MLQKVSIKNKVSKGEQYEGKNTNEKHSIL